MVIGLFPTFMPANRVPVIIPFVITPAIIKRGIVSGRIVRMIRLCRFLCLLTCLCSWGFADQMNQRSKFFPCTNFSLHSWNLWIVLWIVRLPFFPCSFLSQHSWTMTCSAAFLAMPVRGVT